VGKWTGACKKFEREPRPRTERQQRVDELVAGFAGWTAAALATKYREVRREKDALEEKLSGVQEMLDAATAAVVSKYDADGLQSVKLEDGDSVAWNVEPLPSVKDKAAFRAWCVGQGLEGEFQMHPSTAAALIKARIEEGEELPPGIEVYTRDKLSWR